MKAFSSKILLQRADTPKLCFGNESAGLYTTKNSRRLLRVFIFFASVMMCTYHSALASEPIPLDNSLTTKNISNDVDYIEDAKKNLSVEDIVENRSLTWTRSKKNYINFGYTTSQFWFRFTVNNLTKKIIPWLLEIDYPFIDLIELYIPDKPGHFLVKKTGSTMPFGSRDVKDITYIFTIKQKPGSATYFIRIDSRNSVNFKINMLSPDSYIERLHHDLPIYWAYFGLMIVMVLYHLSIFILTRDRVYLYFAAFVALFLLFEFNFKGFTMEFFWPNATWWPRHANSFLICLIILSLDLFLSEFVGFKERFPRLYVPVVYGVILVPSLCALITLFLHVQTGLFVMYTLTLFNVIQLTIIAVYMAFIQKPPSRQARIGIVAFFMLSIGIPIVALTLMGLLPANFFTRRALELGTSLAVVLFSLGIADKINIMKSGIQKAERKYRHLVESTSDIIFTLDDNNNILSMNSAVREHLGFKAEELLNTNFADLILEPWSKTINIRQQMALEYIADLKRKKIGSVRFRTTMKEKYSHEPKELSVNLEYTGDKDVDYVILGKASQIIDDALTQFLVSERYSYNLNNYLSNADLMSQRLVRNLYRFTDPLTISMIRSSIFEVIINSIEHGNLHLTFEEKTDSLHSGTYFDLVRERQMDPSLKERKVYIDYSLNQDRVIYKISDEGEGYDYTSMLKVKPKERTFAGLEHGRGLFIIKGSFDVVKFNKKGNQILLVKYFKNF
jgi:PAS domain S-box-containing protein